MTEEDEFNVGTLYRIQYTDNTTRDGFYDGTRLFSFLAFYDIETDYMFYVNTDSVKMLERLDNDDDLGDDTSKPDPDPEPGGGEALSIPASKPVPAT